jgi:dephospho-CoA kinase
MGVPCRPERRPFAGSVPASGQPPPPMLIVGLTGNIASGKSTVARLMVERGATLIDSDELARRAVEPDTPAFRQIVRRWGNEILQPDGGLDRGALRRQVFPDPSQLEELNRIVHPEVLRLRDREKAHARERGDRIVVCDIPLLFEVNAVDECDRIVLVDAPRPLRLERLVRARSLAETEGMDMIAAQMPAELKRARADYIIDNDGTRTALQRRVDDVWASLQRDAAAIENGEALPTPAEAVAAGA